MFSVLGTRGPVALSSPRTGSFSARRVTLRCQGPQCQGGGVALLGSLSLPIPERGLGRQGSEEGARQGARSGRSAPGVLRDGVGVAGQ